MCGASSRPEGVLRTAVAGTPVHAVATVAESNTSTATTTSSGSSGEWTCSNCTLLNDSSSTKCSVCDSPRTGPTPAAAAAAAGVEAEEQACPVWSTACYMQPDEQNPMCSACGMQFSLFKRPHHCRCCGGSFCSACSEHREVLPSRAQSQRVCGACHTHLLRPQPHCLVRYICLLDATCQRLASGQLSSSSLPPALPRALEGIVACLWPQLSPAQQQRGRAEAEAAWAAGKGVSAAAVSAAAAPSVTCKAEFMAACFKGKLWGLLLR